MTYDAPRRVLIYGLGISGVALGDRLIHRGIEVMAADDSVTDRGTDAASRWGVELIVSPNDEAVAAAVAHVDWVCPAPGIPEHHRLIAAALAANVPILSEIDVAYVWEQQRAGGPRPMLAITGTDGKTTTTLMATAMVNASGRRAVAVGNTEVPLVAEIDGDADVFVVECSSFRLNWLRHFRAEAAVWLNLAEDHQNWHPSMAAYEAAKAKVWAQVGPRDACIGPVSDPVVGRNLARVSGRRLTFGTSDGDYHVRDGVLVTPHGPLVNIAEMSRSLPHDVTNALAAAALVLEANVASPGDVAVALRAFRHPAHRIEPVGCWGGVQWFNDSKATTPHAARTAIRSFDRVVLLAGGRNKDLDLASLARERDRIVGVVALGEAAPIIASIFDGVCPVRVAAESMADAVTAAHQLAEPGDVVLLSPACASFDWYPSGGYPARGDDFKRLVHLMAEGSS